MNGIYPVVAQAIRTVDVVASDFVDQAVTHVADLESGVLGELVFDLEVPLPGVRHVAVGRTSALRRSVAAQAREACAVGAGRASSPDAGRRGDHVVMRDIPDELIDQLLGDYQGPEQLTGPDGRAILKRYGFGSPEE